MEKPSRSVIGLIGGIGSGKSLVAGMLRELGCHVIDADAVGHSLLERPEIVRDLVERFGIAIVGPDGKVVRSVLGSQAFANRESLSRLNRIVHPPLRAELSRRIEEFRADASAGKALVLDAALLLETDWHELCNVLVFVDAPREQRSRRVAQDRGWSAAELDRRENLQKPLDMKRERSLYILENSSSVSRLRRQVRLLYQCLVDPVVGSSQGIDERS